MPGKHHNRTVPVFAPWDGVRRLIRYRVTERKASELVESGRAVRVFKFELRDDVATSRKIRERQEIGIELVMRAKDAVGIEVRALAKKFSAEDSPGSTTRYIRSRSPFQWRRGRSRTFQRGK